MHIMYFTERPYLDVPEDEVLKIQSFFGVPNRFFDPVKGAKLLNEYLDDKVMAEELGFDGVMLNEHHGTPFCMGAVMDMEASILARITKKVRIVLLGNPLPVVANPLRLAEELAMIDMISGGRLVPGWVRGKTTPESAGVTLETLLDHIDHVCQIAGNARHSGIGTDLDGGFGREQSPADLETIADLARSVSMGGQAFPLSFRESVGAADPEAASADLDPRTR